MSMNVQSFACPSNSAEPLVCPLLQLMQESQRNNNSDTAPNVAVVCVHGLVSCLGILENALILWVVGFALRCRRTVASVWVLNLALSDFLATLTLPLFTYYLSHSHSWELPDSLCSAQASIFFLNMFVSAFLLAAISIDRCLLVARPVWCQNHRSVATAWKVCALGWLWAAANTLPYLLFRRVTVRRDCRRLCYHDFAYLSSEATLASDCQVRHVATAVSKMFLAFLVPLVVIAGSYVLFVAGLKRRAQRRSKSSPCRQVDAPFVTITKAVETAVHASVKHPQAHPPTGHGKAPSHHHHHQHQQHSQSFTKMVTTVIAAFVLCWAPYHIFCLIEASAALSEGEERRRKMYLVEVGLPVVSTLAFFNSILNPILYAFCCPDFFVKIRQSLGAVFEGLLEEGGGIGRKLSAVPGIGRKTSRGEVSGPVSQASCPPGSPQPHARNPPTALSLTTTSTQHPQRCFEAVEMVEQAELSGEEDLMIKPPDESGLTERVHLPLL